MKTATLYSPTQVGDVRPDSGIAEVVRKTTDALRRWNTRRQSIRELSVLSDRQLSDIGLVRAEIPEVVDRLLKK